MPCSRANKNDHTQQKNKTFEIEIKEDFDEHVASNKKNVIVDDMHNKPSSRLTN